MWSWHKRNAPITVPPILRRWYWIVGAAVLLIAVVLCVAATRKQLLRFAGHLLVLQQTPIRSADILVISIDSDGAGALEATDLVKSGVSDQVAIVADPPDIIDREFQRRGLAHQNHAAILQAELKLLGVQNVERIAPEATGSEQEGEILPSWCERHGYHTAVVVTLADHSRRLNRILRRSTKGYKVSIAVQVSPYSPFDPNRWWESREETRIEIVELEKLVLDVVRHPLS